jgi:hypothetical protein
VGDEIPSAEAATYQPRHNTLDRQRQMPTIDDSAARRESPSLPEGTCALTEVAASQFLTEPRDGRRRVFIPLEPR